MSLWPRCFLIGKEGVEAESLFSQKYECPYEIRARREASPPQTKMKEKDFYLFHYVSFVC